MKKNKFSLSDVNIIHSDLLQENSMSEIIGGIGNSSATACTCDCFVGNKNREAVDEMDNQPSVSV